MVKKSQKHRKKGVIYTCFTKGYDDLIQHTYIDKNYDYVCFTDDDDLIRQKKIGVWKIRPMTFLELDNARNIRYYKLLPHKIFPEYRLSIWLDTNINILTPKLFHIIAENTKKTFLMPKHHARDCIYQECQRVLSVGKDTYNNVIKTAELLIDTGMPKHYGMNEANILIRRHHNPMVKRLMNAWWHMVVNYSRRDQLSLSYILWQNGICPGDISFDNARNDKENFCFENHKTTTSFPQEKKR